MNDNLLITKGTIKKIGLTETVFLAELLSRERNDNDEVVCTIKDMEDTLGLSRFVQDSTISKLTELNLLKSYVAGLPAKRRFKLNIPCIREVMYM